MIKLLCALYFKLAGWKFVNNTPADLRQYVLIGAPHTSNWDFIFAMTVFIKAKIKGHFAIKKELMIGPLKWIFTNMGAIAIDRKAISSNKKKSTTEAMAELFKGKTDLIMMVAPEGTRGFRDKWKSGFYYTAVKAGVPIVIAYADYSKKELGLGMVIYPSDYEKDMKAIMDFYKNVTPKNPKNFSIDNRFN